MPHGKTTLHPQGRSNLPILSSWAQNWTMRDGRFRWGTQGVIVSQQPSLPSRVTDWLVRLSLTTGLGSLVTRFLARQLTSPQRLPVRRTPDELGFDWEERTCVTEDGYRLRGW